MNDIPADLIFSGTLPITDCEIVLSLAEYNKEMTFRICIYPDYKERIAGRELGDVVTVGMFMYCFGIGSIAISLRVQIGMNSITVHFMRAGFVGSEYF